MVNPFVSQIYSYALQYSPHWYFRNAGLKWGRLSSKAYPAEFDRQALSVRAFPARLDGAAAVQQRLLMSLRDAVNYLTFRFHVLHKFIS